jgi:hypothetical protein
VIQWSSVVNGVPAAGAADMHILSTAALKRHPQRVCHLAHKVRPALPVKTSNIFWKHIIHLIKRSLMSRFIFAGY